MTPLSKFQQQFAAIFPVPPNCKTCKGKGQIYGRITTDPGEPMQWHECSECNGMCVKRVEEV
jgi:DnaJ-class molecular chaperone